MCPAKYEELPVYLAKLGLLKLDGSGSYMDSSSLPAPTSSFGCGFLQVVGLGLFFLFFSTALSDMKMLLALVVVGRSAVSSLAQRPLVWMLYFVFCGCVESVHFFLFSMKGFAGLCASETARNFDMITSCSYFLLFLLFQFFKVLHEF